MNASTFGVSIRLSVHAPHPLMVVELVNILIHLKGAFLSPLSAVTVRKPRSIMRFYHAEPILSEGLSNGVIGILIQIIAHKVMSYVDKREAMGAGMQAWQEPMISMAEIAPVIGPRYCSD